MIELCSLKKVFMNLKQIIDVMIKSYSLKKVLNKIEVSPEQRRVLEDFRVNYANMLKCGLKGLDNIKKYEWKIIGCDHTGAGLSSIGIRVSPETLDKLKLMDKTMKQTYIRKVNEGIADLLNYFDVMFERLVSLKDKYPLR